MVAAIAAAALAAVEIVLLRSVVLGLSAGEAATKALILLGLAAAGRRTLIAGSAQGQQVVSEHIERHTTQIVLEHAAAASYESFESPDFRDRLQRALDAGRTKAWHLVWALITAFSTATTSLALVAVVVALAPGLLLPLGGIGLVFLAVAITKGKLNYALTYRNTRQDRERAYLRQALTSRSEGKEVRLFGSGQFLLERHRRLFDRRVRDVHTVAKKRLLAELFGNGALSVALVFALIVIARRTASGNLDLADAAALAVATQQLTGQIQSLANTVGALVESSYFVADLQRFLEMPLPPRPIPVPGRLDRVRFNNVSFTYPDQSLAALRCLTMEIGANEIVAVVGANGSGKSTLARLAVGLNQPDTGTVELVIDGTSYPVSGPLVGLATAVFQDFARYELSVADNVSLGAPDSTVRTERIESILAALGLSSAITDLPDQLDTLLGRNFARGSDLSGGQWQRLAVARAMYGDPQFVVLDEPTSASDARAESDFFLQLRQHFPGQAILLISHRFASVRRADRILVLEEGALVETGTHDDLIELGGLYASMYAIQAERLLGE